jgi:hypothetical protein
MPRVSWLHSKLKRKTYPGFIDSLADWSSTLAVRVGGWIRRLRRTLLLLPWLRTIFSTWSDFKIVRKGDFGPQSPTFTPIALIGLVAAAGLWTTFLTASSVEGSGAISNISGQAKSMMKLVTA